MTELTMHETKPSSEAGRTAECQENEEDEVNEGGHQPTETVEGMDTKANALMHLLQTSKVSC